MHQCGMKREKKNIKFASHDINGKTIIYFKVKNFFFRNSFIKMFELSTQSIGCWIFDCQI